MKPEYPEKTTDLSQVTDKLASHNVVSSTPRHKPGGFELTTLVMIGTDYTVVVNPYDHDHDGPMYVNKRQRLAIESNRLMR